MFVRILITESGNFPNLSQSVVVVVVVVIQTSETLRILIPLKVSLLRYRLLGIPSLQIKSVINNV